MRSSCRLPALATRCPGAGLAGALGCPLAGRCPWLAPSVSSPVKPAGWRRDCHPDDVSAARDDRRHCLLDLAQRPTGCRRSLPQGRCPGRRASPSPPPRPVPGCGLLCCAADCADVVDSFYESSSPRYGWSMGLAAFSACSPFFPAPVSRQGLRSRRSRSRFCRVRPIRGWSADVGVAVSAKGNLGREVRRPAYFFIRGQPAPRRQGRADGGLDPHSASAQAREDKVLLRITPDGFRVKPSEPPHRGDDGAAAPARQGAPMSPTRIATTPASICWCPSTDRGTAIRARKRRRHHRLRLGPMGHGRSLVRSGGAQVRHVYAPHRAGRGPDRLGELRTLRRDIAADFRRLSRACCRRGPLTSSKSV